MADTVKYRFTMRRGLAADWTSKNEILLQGEFGLELDSDKVKIGDGTTAWNSLPYFAASLGGINNQTGTAYVLALTDVEKSIVANNASTFTLTVPNSSTVAFNIGTRIAYTTIGAGKITLAAASGVTLHSPNGLDTHALYDGGVLELIAANVWIVWNSAQLATVASTGNYNDLIGAPVQGIAAINQQTGTTYTISSGDVLKAVRCTNSSSIVVTIPTNTTDAIPLLSQIPVFQGGAGLVTIAAASGVTLESPAGLSTAAIGDFRLLFKRDTNTWIIA